MAEYTRAETRQALGPIDSLISKSVKAQEKLAADTWQYRMLENNLSALRVAAALITDEAGGALDYPREQLRNALRALEDMRSRSEKARAMFSPGTSQHTLQINRLHAFDVAESLVRRALETADP